VEEFSNVVWRVAVVVHCFLFPFRFSQSATGAAGMMGCFMWESRACLNVFRFGGCWVCGCGSGDGGSVGSGIHCGVEKVVIQ
jgi:hypothetical protein